MPSGILIIDKPALWTSHDVVAKVRRILNERRVGHAGTLDPMATGVLPLFVGRATRGVEFAAGGDKEYEATLRLGVVTDTDDTTGRVLETNPVAVTDDRLRAVLTQFAGRMEQIPPMYSAIKQGGKKLYELARAGKEVVRPPRSVTIYELTLTGRDGDDVALRVRCSKGTYIRTLCHDIGAALGCGGTMSALRRTWAAGFSLSEAVTIEALAAMEDPTAALLPLDRLFQDYPAQTVDAQTEQKIKTGAHPDLPCGDGSYRLYSGAGEFLALAEKKQGKLQIKKRFFEVAE